MEQLLENALAWPTVAAGLTKEEVKEIRCQAGLILFTFNTEFSSLDGKGFDHLLILKESISLAFLCRRFCRFTRECIRDHKWIRCYGYSHHVS